MMEEAESVSGTKRVLFVKKQSLCQKKFCQKETESSPGIRNIHIEAVSCRNINFIGKK
jgi:hypothetical protein